MSIASKSLKLSIVAVALACGCQLNAGQPIWQPARTWVFAVGVIKFDDCEMNSRPYEGRMDVILVHSLEKRGVPKSQILFIKDEQATHANIMSKSGPFLRRAGSDDTLIFYYAGHGTRDYSKQARPSALLTFDTKAEWTVDSILDGVKRDFHGRQVIYMADCCHSGSLVIGSAQQRGHTAALSSSEAASTSTGNWAFTKCLVNMFEGSPLLDQDDNGQITFAEAANYSMVEMALVEGQHTASGVNGGFPASTVMSKTITRPHTTPDLREIVEGQWQGEWYKAVVLERKGGLVLVTWPGWGRNYDEWLPQIRTRPYRPKTFRIGAAVLTEWNNKWYNSRVVNVELGLYRVHYAGFPDSDDEWLAPEQLRMRPRLHKIHN